MVQKPRKTIDKALPALAERQRDLLRAVIREYIATAEPVASAALVRRYGLDVSSATVRNALAALEELGLLTHPHTSAGRVPTDLGYRYFIESLMPMSGLRAEEQVTVSHQFQQALTDTGAWLRVAASSLARLTAEASLVTPPAAKRATPSARASSTWTDSRTSLPSPSSPRAIAAARCSASSRITRVWPRSCRSTLVQGRSTSRSAASTGTSRFAVAAWSSAATEPTRIGSGSVGLSGRRGWTSRGRPAAST